MHPLVLQELAADHISYMIAQAEDRRLARRARLVRGRTPRKKAKPAVRRTQADPKRPSPTRTVPGVPADTTSRSSVDERQSCGLALAERAKVRAQ